MDEPKLSFYYNDEVFEVAEPVDFGTFARWAILGSRLARCGTNTVSVAVLAEAGVTADCLREMLTYELLLPAPCDDTPYMLNPAYGMVAYCGDEGSTA